MRILIVDDESSARKLLVNKLQPHIAKISRITEADNVRNALEAIANDEFDLIFLDIQMPDGTGFDLLANIPDHQALVAFTTAHDEFALKAFEFAAIGYLLKPIDQAKLDHVFELAGQVKRNHQNQYKLLVESYREKKVRKLVIPNAEGFLISEISDILYVKSDINYSIFYFKDQAQSLVSAKTLKEYTAILESEGFFRVHQSYLINLSYAREFKKNINEVILSDGTRIPVARQKKASFQAVFS